MHLEYLEEVKKVLHGKSFTVVGKSVRRVDAIEKVTGLAKYVADHLLEEALIVKAVRSPYPHAIVKNIDKSGALKVPGVECVITAEDIPGENQVGIFIADQPLIATEARYVGDIVALVVARNEEAARQGLDELKVEYEELPTIFDPEEALSNTIKVHDGGNIAKDVKVRKGDVEEAFRQCNVIVERTYKAGSQEHAYLEPDVAIAIPTGDNHITVISQSQGPFRTRESVARILGWQYSDITVITPYVGGAFGAKDAYGHVICSMAALATAKLHKPVIMAFSRYELFAYRFKRAPFKINYKSGATKDGKLKAIQVDFMVDIGPCATQSIFIMDRAAYHATGVYEVPNVKVDGIAVYTNNLPNAAFNGFGNPQMLFATESQMDILAEELNMDPIELRLKNVLVPGSRTGTNQLLDHSVGIKELIAKVAEETNWRKRKVEYANYNTGTKRRGIGVGCSWHGCGTTGLKTDWAGASVIINPDGSLTYSSAVVEMGQGTTTSHAMMIAEILGIPVKWVKVSVNNSDTVPDSGITHAQRGVFVMGTAAVDAALKLRKKVNKLAAEVFGCKEDEIAIDNGEAYNVNNTSQKVSFKDLAKGMYQWGLSPAEYGFITVRRGHADPKTGQGDIHAAFSFGCTIAEVEVDLETGQVQVLRLSPGVAAGKIIHPELARGQVYGCSIMGLGYALTERVVREDGKILNLSYTDYLIPTIKDKPQLPGLLCVEDEYKYSGFGAKGVGEIAFIATPSAIANAVYDAIGIRFYEIPLDAERICFAIRKEESDGGRS